MTLREQDAFNIKIVGGFRETFTHEITIPHPFSVCTTFCIPPYLVWSTPLSSFENQKQGLLLQVCKQSLRTELMLNLQNLKTSVAVNRHLITFL